MSPHVIDLGIKPEISAKPLLESDRIEFHLIIKPEHEVLLREDLHLG
jgi:hypothetical protein